jgi:hypothetical protein
MFQLAAGLSLANRLDTDLQLNVSSFNGDRMRQYSLGLWLGINLSLVQDLPEPIICESGLPYEPNLFAGAPKDCSIRGYFQTEKYFSDIKEEVRDIFSHPGPLTERGRRTLLRIDHAGNESVFLTIRRTDYVGNSFHGLLGMDYYLAALDILSEKMNPRVFVFTDDIDWVAESFSIPYEWHLAGNFDRTTADHLGREDEELYLMSRCRHGIMANSSYSWWGSFLGGDAPDRITVAPKNWFGPRSTENPKDIYREVWLVI